MENLRIHNGDWVVVCDGAKALILENAGDAVALNLKTKEVYTQPDPKTHDLVVWKTSTIPGDSTFLFTMRYEAPDTNSLRFITAIRGDSLRVDLVRTARHFQLTERQFHWLSEYNR